MTTASTPPLAHHSHLFHVRLWLEIIDDHQVELRGQVQHVLTGEVHYFRDWKTLNQLLSDMLLYLEVDLLLDYRLYPPQAEKQSSHLPSKPISDGATT